MTLMVDQWFPWTVSLKEISAKKQGGAVEEVLELVFEEGSKTPQLS